MRADLHAAFQLNLTLLALFQERSTQKGLEGAVERKTLVGAVGPGLAGFRIKHRNPDPGRQSALCTGNGFLKWCGIEPGGVRQSGNSRKPGKRASESVNALRRVQSFIFNSNDEYKQPEPVWCVAPAPFVFGTPRQCRCLRYNANDEY